MHLFFIASVMLSVALGSGIWAWLTIYEQSRRMKKRMAELSAQENLQERTVKLEKPTPKNYSFENLIFLFGPTGLAIAWQQVVPGPVVPKLMIAIAVSVFLKIIWKRHQINRYRIRIEEALPTTLDLLVVCIEAGMSLASALVRVAEETRGGPLSDELKKTFYEMNVGLSMEQAFRNLAVRTNVVDVGSLVTTIIEAEQIGMKLGETLRSHSAMLRETIRMRTREKILKIPVKVLFPLVFFFMPAIFSIVLAPAVIKLIPVFQSMGK